MSGAKTVLYGFLGCGGLATVAWLLSSFLGKKSSILEAVHKITQKTAQESIKGVEEEQVVLETTINTKEKTSKDIVERIEIIQKNATREIQEVLKHGNLAKIHQEVDTEWENL